MESLDCEIINPSNTIVTACDSSYFWGAFLLISSIRFSSGVLPIIVMSHGLNRKQKEFLLQFENVTVKDSVQDKPHLNKSGALAYADTKYITWLDADCVYVGNIDKLLIPKNGNFQIRFREAIENQDVFMSRASGQDAKGCIPEAIMKTWQKDVNENTISRYKTQCVTNSFCIHRDELEIVSFNDIGE